MARIMAPSVIFIDECEKATPLTESTELLKVFLTDKKKMKEFGGTEPFSRIKKDLLKEASHP